VEIETVRTEFRGRKMGRKWLETKTIKLEFIR
jgi:hypothetical protein